MKKRKILKTLAFSSLAVVIAAGGIFAFAPIGASASTPPPTTTTGLGLDPKNDPVVYTTESGLEIRMSNADKFSGIVTTTTNAGYTYTQDLSSFYYFTMGTFSGTIYTAKTQTDTYEVKNEPVNWIILGVGSHSNAFVESVSNYLFSTIKNNDYLFSNGEYYFDNQHETFSPAGQLIDSTISAKTYLMGKVKDSIKVHTEIPKGCMLVLSEALLGQMYFNSSGALNYGIYTSWPYCYMTEGNGTYGNRYRYKGDTNTATSGAQTWNNKTDGSLYVYINSLFNKNNSTGAIEGDNKLGFTQAQADLVVPQQLYTSYSNGKEYPLTETPNTDGGTYYTMFPMAMGEEGNAFVSGTQNFVMSSYIPSGITRAATYISTTQCQSYWSRSGSLYSDSGLATAFQYNLGQSTNNTCKQVYGVRPAMVMKLA